jgi:hypothetical protein
MSAAISHCEAFTKRCGIRFADEFGSFVHQMMGGLLTIDLDKAKATPAELRELVVSEQFRDSLYGRKEKSGISLEDGEDFAEQVGSEVVWRV